MFPARAVDLLLSAALLASAIACSASTPREPQGPSLSFDHSLGEGSGDDEPDAAPAPAKPHATTQPEAPSHDDAKSVNEAPDPEPLRLASQWEYRLAYDEGEVRVTSVRPKQFEEPVVTPRRYGRYAIELWIGRELVDRVRFDFPLVQPEAHTEHPGGGQTPISLSAGAHSAQTVLVPASPRATRAVLVDSSNGQLVELTWPPDRPLGPKASAR